MKRHERSYLHSAIYAKVQDNSRSLYVLCRERLVVHQKKVNISGIMNDECFVAGRHQMPSFFVGTVSDLNYSNSMSLDLQQCNPSFMTLVV